MKKLLTAILVAFGLASISIFQGCMKDTFQRSYTYTFYKPVYRTTAEVRANIKSNAPAEIERPGKLFLKGTYLFLNEIDKGIHIIDNSNPSNPRNVAFINIPGNMDLAVKGNTLYADLYTDLVAIDISNPQNVQLKKVIEDVFPHRYYTGYFVADSTKVIVEWEKRDTTIKEKGQRDLWQKNNPGIFFALSDSRGNGGAASSSPNVSVSPYGVGGSMARFTVTKERLYTVGYADLDVFNIANEAEPIHVNRKNMGWNIETIYPFKDKLFIGSQSGMFIYNINNPDDPQQMGSFDHVRSCDPVIADNEYAYVTLRSGSACQGFSNELDIVKLNEFVNPSLLKVYNLANPHGLSKDGNTLFICDGQDGLKIYNAADALNLKLLHHIRGLDTYDVIAINGNALVVANDGLYQYDYRDLTNIRLLSKVTLK